MVDAERIRNTLVVAIMSRDSADGVLKLERGRSPDEGDGAISVHWPTLRDQPAFVEQHRTLERLLANSPLKAGRMLPNPVWKPFPEKLDYLLGGQTGPLLTVHPLGGCPMGDAPVSGVVDHIGRVFDPDATAPLRLHEGLAVLDGSIVPTSLGINPALTIASIAWRAVTQLRRQWGFKVAQGSPQKLAPRPRFCTPEVVKKPRPTKVEVLERLSGSIPSFGTYKNVYVELTMHFDPVEVRELMKPGAVLNLDASRGRLQIFSHSPAGDRKSREEAMLLDAKLRGSLRVLHRDASTPIERHLRGIWAWFRNRGLRDLVLWRIDRWRGQEPPPKDGQGAWSRARNAWDLASRAGAVRLLDYEWTVDEIVLSKDVYLTQSWTGQTFNGSKKLTYSRRSNPWRQLSAVRLESFPGLAWYSTRPVLTLDTGYLAYQGVPLLRIVDQQDQPSALADLTTLVLYLLRILLQVHVWSFRLPDRPRPSEISRLPGLVPGLPRPTIRELPVDTMPDGRPVMVRLTHYPFGAKQRSRACAEQPDAHVAICTPVLMIHGYSASGTTFAHHAVRPNLAEALWKAGRDVWIVDLRTSAGMPHARHPWTFENAAYADIPVAVDHVLAATGQPRIDVFAHCMGSAMLGMALLAQKRPHEPFWALREKLPSRIRSLAISQVPPAMVFTPANVLRAYLMRYLQHYLPLENWQFRGSAKPGVGEQLVDRLLATLPYPQEEFDRENPFWTPWRRTPWVGTRHRMDALYGRDFSVNNLSGRMLDCIDDHFGPLNIETVSQAIHFARYRSIASHRGSNRLLSPHRLRERYAFPVMVLHGEDNGLMAVQTLQRFKDFSEEAPATQPLPTEKQYPGFGHQDCLIGIGASEVFRDVIGFFNGVDGASAPVGSEAEQHISISFVSQWVAFGVRLSADTANPERLEFSVGDDQSREIPLFGVFVPVAWRDDGRCRLVDRDGAEVDPGVEAFRLLATVAIPKPVDPDDEDTRLSFDIDRARLAPGADGLLVMLMYLRSAEIRKQAPATVRTLFDAARWLVVKALPAGFERMTMRDATGATAEPQSDLGSRIRIVEHEMARSIHRKFHGSSDESLRLSVVGPLRGSQGEKSDLICCFVLASCQYPGGLLDRTPPGIPGSVPQTGPSDASWLRLAKRLDDKKHDAPSFMILAGDQVYVDAAAGLFDPKTLDERFDRAYENFLGARGPRSVLGRLPAYMLPDDHEIDNDWEPDPAGANPLEGRPLEKRGKRRPLSNEELKRRGVDAYLRYQRELRPTEQSRKALWQKKTIGGLPFFLATAAPNGRRGPRLSCIALICLESIRRARSARGWRIARSQARAF